MPRRPVTFDKPASVRTIPSTMGSTVQSTLAALDEVNASPEAKATAFERIMTNPLFRMGLGMMGASASNIASMGRSGADPITGGAAGLMGAYQDDGTLQTNLIARPLLQQSLGVRQDAQRDRSVMDALSNQVSELDILDPERNQRLRELQRRRMAPATPPEGF